MRTAVLFIVSIFICWLVFSPVKSFRNIIKDIDFSKQALKNLRIAIKEGNREAVISIAIWWSLFLLASLLSFVGLCMALYFAIRIMR